MKNIIYLNKVDNYADILKKDKKKIPLFLIKLIYIYKKIFCIITKKNISNLNIWTLPIKDKENINKISNIMKKLALNRENIYVIPKELECKEFYNKMNLYGIEYLSEIRMKKILLKKAIEYIINIQKININDINLTILVNRDSELNLALIEYLSKLVKTLKIVSTNIYKFKNFEENLYKEYGIALQFSNSYKKSLDKSKIIINLDFNTIDINEYEIFNNAIIINCAEDNIKIKSKLFNGIIINSYNIQFRKEIKEIFKNVNLYNKYNNLILYESYIHDETKLDLLLKKIEKDNVLIDNFIGNNGIINKNEFKNIHKSLDK